MGSSLSVSGPALGTDVFSPPASEDAPRLEAAPSFPDATPHPDITSPAPSLPDATARGFAAVADAASRLAAQGWSLRIFPSDPAEVDRMEEGWPAVRVSVSEPGYVWEERRSVRWVEPPGVIAYLKAAFLSEEGLELSASSLIDWKFNWGGRPAPDDPHSRWRVAHLHARALPVSARSLGRRWQDASPSSADIEADLAALGESFADEWRAWVSRMRQPFVDYVNVAPNRRRRGVATALYQAAAGFLGEHGLTLRASTLQQPEAAAAWEKLASIWDLVKVPVPGYEEQSTYVFDLRPARPADPAVPSDSVA